MSKLPPDLLVAIQEYANPETTWVLTKLQELQKKEPILFYKAIDKEHFNHILQYMKLIPIIYVKTDKYLITQEEKHKLESFYDGYMFGRYGGHHNISNLSKICCELCR
jgi:hypothetical protein